MRIPQINPSDIHEDEQATMEAASLAIGIDISSVEADQRVRKIIQEGAVQDHIHLIKVGAIYLSSAVITVLFLILFFHFSAPRTWGFLDEEQILALKQILFSGAMGAILSNLIGKHLK